MPITHLMTSFPHRQKYSFQETPPSIEEELAAYRRYAQEATVAGNQTLADRWTLTANAVASFIEYNNSSNQLALIKDLPLSINTNHRALEMKEISLYTVRSLEAMRTNNITLAQQLIADAEATKEAGIRYRHWAACAQEKLSALHSIRDIDAEQAAASYRANALKAAQAGNKKISQQWAEAACLAQDTAKKAWQGKSAYVITGNEIAANRWALSTYASFYASQIRASVAAALEQEQHTKSISHLALSSEFEKAALIAEDIATYREKAVRATIEENEAIASQWSNTAHVAGNAFEAKMHIIEALKQGDKIFLPYLERIVFLSKKTTACSLQLIEALQQKKKRSEPYWMEAISLAEASLDDAKKTVDALRENDLASAKHWEKKSFLTEQACNMKMKAAHAMKSWWWLGFASIFPRKN